MARRTALRLAVMGAGLALAAAAHGQTTARVTATDPAGDVIRLGRDEPLYIRIAFTSDEPVSIWARPFFHGKEVTTVKTNASWPHAGSGDALGWFSFDGPGEVDEIRILTSAGHSRYGRLASSYRVHVVGTNEPAVVRPTVDWVADLEQQEALIERQQAARRASEPTSAGEAVFFVGFMLLVLGVLGAGIGAPAWGLWRWRGGWRMAALAPALLMAFVILRIVTDTAQDPTSHNLWPFELLHVGVLSVAIMGALVVARRIARANG